MDKRVKSSSKKETSQGIKSGQWGFRLGFFILFILVLGASFFGWMQIESLKEALVEKEITQPNNIKQQVAQLSATQENQKKILFSVLSQLEQINSEQKKSSTFYQKEEILTLVKLAQRYLIIEKNPTTALNYLRLASMQIQHLTGEFWTQFNSELNLKINALGVIDSPNTTGVFEKFNAVSEAMKVIPLKQKHVTEKSPEKTDNNSESPFWQDAKKRFLNTLKKAVVIQHNSISNSIPILPQRNYLIANIDIALLQAKGAFLEKQAIIYQESLDQIIRLLEDYFVNSAEAKKTIMTLQTLKSIQLNPKLPDLTPLIKKLNLKKQNDAPPPSNQIQTNVQEVLPS